MRLVILNLDGKLTFSNPMGGDRFLFANANFEPPSPPKNVKMKFIVLFEMHVGGKCKISWSNDDLERFLKVRAL